MDSYLALNGGPKVHAGPFPAWPVWDDTEREALLAVLDGGKWGRLAGDRATTFETAFANFQGAEYGVAVMNGSIALLLALLAAGIEEGDEVIVPPYTFSATATCVVCANAVPIFADIDENSFCLDPDAFEAAITPRTKAVIPVHLGGQAADMDRIMAIAQKHGIVVIEDACHAHGASYRGKDLGTIGDMGCFSFQSSKNLTAGEGGIVITDNARYASECHAIHHCGRRPGSEWYEHPILGINYRPSEFLCALLLCQLARLEEQTATRNRNGLYLNAILAEIPGIHPLPRGQGEDVHSYHLYPFRYDAEAFDGIPRATFVNALSAEGIPASQGYTMPLYRQEVFLNKAFGPYTGYRHTRPELDYAKVHCPVCERICEREACWLPQTVMLGTKRDMDDIAEAIKKVYEHRDELA